VSEVVAEVLDAHNVRHSLASLLLWERPAKSFSFFAAGAALYMLVEVFEVGIMVVIGSCAILQLLVYRGAQFLQEKEMAFEDVDLREKFVLTPDPTAVSTAVLIVGDFFRISEESIKELSLTNDYFRLAQAFAILLFLSALGRVLSLGTILILVWVLSFVLPLIYVSNQELIDRVIDRTYEASKNIFNQQMVGGRKRDA